jgi:uncharacterized protein YgiB involved in biofilm formation
MKPRHPLHFVWTDQRIAAAIAGGALCLVTAILVLVLSHRGADYALVLVTGDDCRRYFDDTECREIVTKANALHADTAPRFANLETCALVYGAGRCDAVSDHDVQLRQMAPMLTAIALSRAKDVIVPLYVGPLSEQGLEAAKRGRTVYFNRKRIGRLAEASMGGASLPMLSDETGQPITADALRGLAAH